MRGDGGVRGDGAGWILQGFSARFRAGWVGVKRRSVYGGRLQCGRLGA